ncbi:hypothetical protein DOTSEDRAFT_64796 [Dothistroma septosporum NZE10]|uniref:Uncharacterized protein n=1 Tax=Dothistroma septosporum (strain NZE10 / CBS 128990) TaxID=675120 RepID=N1PGH9_DOTSN|nr:hypothetical protein DOTSEDRAFT_64796 [Dothistroma septosporum NZE10]
MSDHHAHLTNLDRKHRNLSNGREISSSSTLSFTSHLSSLINASSTSNAKSAPARSRPRKEDIFATHNKNSAKRAKRDLEADHAGTFQQKHSTQSDPLDANAWERSKRKMEAKARLYAAMKRGDVQDEDGKYAVDFDAKWAEARVEEREEESDDDDLDSDDGAGDEVEYLDEFGRTRKGTKLDATRAETSRRRNEGAQDADAARPSAPSNVIYGDTIQHEAFNPNTQTWDAMSKLAKKRDKSLTPPPEEHFDSNKEIRTKGTGFFQFSGNAEERKRQMENLEQERAETEMRRQERDGKINVRRAEIEKRREEIRRKSAKRKADEFLKDLGAQMSAQEEQSDAKDASGTGTDMTDRIEAVIQREVLKDDET